MNKALLERCCLPVVEIPELPVEAQKVIQMAHARFGTVLPKVRSTKLHTMLREMGIRPFTHESIKAYKDDVHAKNQAKAKSLQRWWRSDDEKSTGYHLTHFQWQTRSLADFGAAVPTFVLETAMRVASEAAIRNLHLKYEVEAFTKGDPFLVVSLNDEWFHLEVWDEPNFMEEREI